jgi:2-C-methyl-D-erythritol 4-phosphate cytidylyltransferase
MRIHVLIPCGGTGSRAGGELPKQYRTIAGEPMVAWTLRAFAQVPRVSRALTVIAPDDRLFETLLDAADSIARCAGSMRANTVLNGLKHLLVQGADAQDWVLVHDAARCLITPQQINTLIDACINDPVGGLLALPLSDTLKSEREGRVHETVSRMDKWLAQTPQMFRIGALHDALIEALDRNPDGVTDEASAMEMRGLRPKLVRGSAQNFKITYPEDFALAEAILLSRKTST